MSFVRFLSILRAWQKSSRNKYSHDIVDPIERRRSRFYALWVDHEILRICWHNFAEIVPSVYRSNHPTHERLEQYAAMGIKSVLNLRGATRHSHYRFEVETCSLLGLELIDIPLSACKAPSKTQLIEVVDILSKIQKPFLMHCKSGADRTGLVAAIYLIQIEEKSITEAKKQLSFRFVHLRFTKTGILDYIIWVYGKRVEQGAICFRDWVEAEYDSSNITAEFARTSLWQRLTM